MSDYHPARRVGHCNGAELWIGSARDAADPEFCSKFALIVNCTRHLPSGHIRVAVHDAPQENDEMLRALPAACKAVRAALHAGGHVLVHCHAGMQRSATVVAATLVSMGVGSLDEVVREIRRVKPETFPNVNPDGTPTFWPALREFCAKKSWMAA